MAAIAATFVVAAALAPSAAASGVDPDDELLTYRGSDGSYGYYDISGNGSLGTPIRQGAGYAKGWTSITALDLDGRGQDEMLFYRSTDGKYAYFNVAPNGSLGTPIRQGTGYAKGWTSITALDLEGDGQDEVLFYRSTDGKYAYFNIKANGSLGTPIRQGTGYATGWTSITPVDLDGGGQDEVLFYRSTDGKYAYYNIAANGSLGAPTRQGTGYATGWTSITAVDLDGDAEDELIFYRSSDGRYSHYNIAANGSLGSPTRQGSGYQTGWTSVTAVDLHGDLPVERVSRFTTFFNCCEARVTNIRTMARALNGYVLLPGESLSIDAVIGPRTTAKGYVPAPYLLAGEGQCCAVGGGVSQFGTTIHNAVFWGGFRVLAHQPHSAWISRYPLGIEATLVYRSIDYRFRNDTASPLTIRTSTTGTSLTVELWGYQGGWQVTGRHPTGARSSSVTVLDDGGSSAKRVSARVTGSAPGQVKIVRSLVTGGVRRSQTWFWNYLG